MNYSQLVGGKIPKREAEEANLKTIQIVVDFLWAYHSYLRYAEPKTNFSSSTIVNDLCYFPPRLIAVFLLPLSIRLAVQIDNIEIEEREEEKTQQTSKQMIVFNHRKFNYTRETKNDETNENKKFKLTNRR